MKKGLIVKGILGLLLIVLLIVAGYRMIGFFADTIVGMINNETIADDSGDYQLYTPEPMPTMPAYMGEDSFYDNAGDVVFGDE